MPAPKGNTNSLQNGTRSNRLTVGEWPNQLRAVKREGRAYRRLLESATHDTYGSISIDQAHHIDTAAAGTIHAGICRWVMRQKIETMSPTDVIACSREMVRAKQARDAAVARLALESHHSKIIEALYADPDDDDQAHIDQDDDDDDS